MAFERAVPHLAPSRQESPGPQTESARGGARRKSRIVRYVFPFAALVAVGLAVEHYVVTRQLSAFKKELEANRVRQAQRRPSTPAESSEWIVPTARAQLSTKPKVDSKPDDSSEPKEATTQAESATQQSEPPSTQEYLAYFESVFEDQAFDRQWARGVEEAITNELQTRLGESTLENVECRATMCKATLLHKDELGLEHFVKRAYGSPTLWRGPTASLLEEGSTTGVRSSFFFIKEGHPLPQIE